MNKKVLFAGMIAVAGFVTLTAFGGKTRADQQIEIDNAVKAKLETYRTELTAACDARVEAEAMTRYDAVVAQRAAEEAAKPAAGKKGGKKVTKGPKVDPLPQPTKPAPTDPQKTRGGVITPEAQKNPPATTDPATQKKRGGLSGGGGGN